MTDIIPVPMIERQSWYLSIWLNGRRQTLYLSLWLNGSKEHDTCHYEWMTYRIPVTMIEWQTWYLVTIIEWQTLYTSLWLNGRHYTCHYEWMEEGIPVTMSGWQTGFDVLENVSLSMALMSSLGCHSIVSISFDLFDLFIYLHIPLILQVPHFLYKYSLAPYRRSILSLAAFV